MVYWFIAESTYLNVTLTEVFHGCEHGGRHNGLTLRNRLRSGEVFLAQEMSFQGIYTRRPSIWFLQTQNIWI